MWDIVISGTKEVYVNHVTDDCYMFVARFKYARAKSSANHFVKFLTKNFTPNEYFTLFDLGATPLGILESKGYISLNVLKSKRV